MEQHKSGITLYDVGRLENNMRAGKALAYDEAAKVIEGILNNFTKKEREKIAMIAGIMLEADDEQKDCGKIAVPEQINVGGERARYRVAPAARALAVLNLNRRVT